MSLGLAYRPLYARARRPDAVMGTAQRPRLSAAEIKRLAGGAQQLCALCRATREYLYPTKLFVEVDVTEKFPFLVTKMSPPLDQKHEEILT